MNAYLPAQAETITIRQMTSDDIEQVLAIDQMSFSMPWPISAYKYELNENQNSKLWVAEVESAGKARKVIGIIVVWFIMDEAHIATIAVHPDFRGRGIAHTMLVIAIKEAIQQGSTRATLEVRATNSVAQSIYRRFRFEIVGHRLRYYGDNNEDALIMTVDGLDSDYLNWLESGAWQMR